MNMHTLFSNPGKKLILTGVALGISLQAMLWLSHLITERGILGALVYPLIGIGVIAGISAYLSHRKLTFWTSLFALMFAWPVVKLLYLLLPVSWLAFLLQIAVTGAFFVLAHTALTEWRGKLWPKLSIGVVLFVVWFFTISIAYSYLARRIAAATYFS
ncbi:MAG TPA: hypothetical protein VFG56_00615 [Candidatus Saccharimonadales bacterium]|nr:hypothetical protein [Candidatus Saccharimonadales bacterium]